ncbi:hypothetical protein HOY80DRAFT_1137801 [Tuber brumale]|nr:hypothetical protein HOY80DRAFT_1137801 [Tuber brumale]
MFRFTSHQVFKPIRLYPHLTPIHHAHKTTYTQSDVVKNHGHSDHYYRLPTTPSSAGRESTDNNTFYELKEELAAIQAAVLSMHGKFDRLVANRNSILSILNNYNSKMHRLEEAIMMNVDQDKKGMLLHQTKEIKKDVDNDVGYKGNKDIKVPVDTEEDSGVDTDKDLDVCADEETEVDSDEDAEMAADEETDVDSDEDTGMAADEETEVDSDEDTGMAADEETEVDSDEDTEMATADDTEGDKDDDTEGDKDEDKEECSDEEDCSNIVQQLRADIKLFGEWNVRAPKSNQERRVVLQLYKDIGRALRQVARDSKREYLATSQ